jgi:hypothetical protein
MQERKTGMKTRAKGRKKEGGRQIKVVMKRSR